MPPAEFPDISRGICSRTRGIVLALHDGIPVVPGLNIALMQTLILFVAVAVAGMALLPEASAYVDVGKDPATAYAPSPAEPGNPVIIDFTADEAGTFPIVCSETCGDGHADMRGSLVVTAASK